MNTPFRSSTLGLTLGVAAALFLSGCAAPADETSPSGALRVVATTTQLSDFVREIGGDHTQVTGLLTAGASAHHFDPSSRDLLALSRADVLVVNGAGLETFVDSAIEASGFSGTVVTASDGIDLAEARAITEEGEGGTEHAEDHDHDHAEDHANDDADVHDHDHDHGDINPHLWTSPRYAAAMAAEVERALVAADPEHAAQFRANAEIYLAKLSALDGWVAAQFAQVPAAERVLVSGHDSLRYYLHDYGIRFGGAILPSFEDNAEPSAAAIDDLVKRIREQGVRAIFVESSMSPKLARTIAREAGVAVVDAETLFADSLGASGSGAETYIEATVHNTRVILEAWGYTPGSLPDELEQP